MNNGSAPVWLRNRRCTFGNWPVEKRRPEFFDVFDHAFPWVKRYSRSDVGAGVEDVEKGPVRENPAAPLAGDFPNYPESFECSLPPNAFSRAPLLSCIK